MPSYLSSYLSFFQGVNEEGILRRRIEAVITGQTRNLLALFIGLVGSNPTVSAIEGSLAKLGFVRLFSLLRREECCTSIHAQSCQHCFCRRYFWLIVKMSVNICRSGEVAVSEPFLNFFHRYVVRKQQAGTGVPLRYNYDKPEKPRISRVFGYLARFFILFQTEKSSREVVIS